MSFHAICLSPRCCSLSEAFCQKREMTHTKKPEPAPQQQVDSQNHKSSGRRSQSWPEWHKSLRSGLVDDARDAVSEQFQLDSLIQATELLNVDDPCGVAVGRGSASHFALNPRLPLGCNIEGITCALGNGRHSEVSWNHRISTW